MVVTEKGQITIPKHIRTAAGVLPGSEVMVTIEAGKIIISKVGSGIGNDRRARLRAAAAKAHESLAPEFQQMGADEIMAFLRGDDAPR